MNRYYKHFILCGDIDQYCLLCKETFQRIPDIMKHLRGEEHRSIASEQTFIKKFQRDHIYKIGAKFYCEVCNRVSPHMTSLKEHLKSEKHNALMTNPTMEIKKPGGIYVSGYVIIDKKVLLDKYEWHTIVKNECLVCKVAVLDPDIVGHIESDDHMINIIQSEVSYADDQFHRKINEELCHCFTCKKVFKPADFKTHWPNCKNPDDSVIQSFRESRSRLELESLINSINIRARAEQEIYATFGDFYIIDKKNNTSVCKFCYSPLPMDNVFKAMIEHMKEHLNNKWWKKTDVVSDDEAGQDGQGPSGSAVAVVNVTDNGKIRSECAAYGKLRYIRLNHNGSKGYCRLCDKYMSASIVTFREHCKGLIHVGLKEIYGIKKPVHRINTVYSSQSIKEYITRMEYSPPKLSVWVNHALFLTLYSLFLLRPIVNNPHMIRTKCFACNMLIKRGTERKHCLTEKHRDVFMSAKIIAKEAEFIREIHPNLFHCGFCNITLPYSNEVERHLVTVKHKKSIALKMALYDIITYHRVLDVEAAKAEGDDKLYIQLFDYFFDFDKL